MEIIFSRHARRRAKLYKLKESDIISLITIKNYAQGEHEILNIIEGYKYPLKIIFVVEGNVITIITNFPLKKGLKQ